MSAENGAVYLVGAGPGDPRLATRRALDLIARADVIVHDRLVASELLDHARPQAELVYVGKQAGAPSPGQDEINALLIEHARKGRQVVRLKGGDPFVFGRGGEEAEALAAAAIRFEVVPGVTSGVAAPAYAGIPVTHRDEASAVAFVTGHEDPDKAESAIDWRALAAFPGTLVFYMGVRNLPLVAERLIEHGRPRDEPAAVVERGSLPGQRSVAATLGAIAERAAADGIRAPAVTVVGPVAALHERLAWLEPGPLRGLTIAVTRARAQASALRERLGELGARVVEVPAIRIEARIEEPEVRAAVASLAGGEYDVVCLTSPNGAELLLEALARQGRDSRALAGVTIAAIGPGTAGALEERGLKADVVPERSIAEALVHELQKTSLEGKRVLVARASQARAVLPESLQKAGAAVDVIALYDTVQENLGGERLAALMESDYITFTSSSTVRNLLAALGGAERFPREARVVSIGPVTSATAREMGLEVDVEASRHDIDGLVDALIADALA
jgi:uroporphyrinogen III methyltransferase / synthase